MLQRIVSRLYNLISLLLLHHFLLQLASAEEEPADGEESGDAGNAEKVADRVVVAEDHVAGDGYGEDLQNTGGGGVDEHPDELQPHDNGQDLMQEAADVAGGAGVQDQLNDLPAHGRQQYHEGDDGDEFFQHMEQMAEKVLESLLPGLGLPKLFVHFLFLRYFHRVPPCGFSTFLSRRG